MSFSNLFASLKNVIKAALADDNNEYVVLKHEESGSEARVMLHDCAHLQVARLDPIPVRVHKDGVWTTYMVDGISGVSIPEFGRADLPAEYDGELDEARTGIHQWFQEPTRPIYCVRMVYWCFYLMTVYKANPCAVVLAHASTVKDAYFKVRR